MARLAGSVQGVVVPERPGQRGRRRLERELHEDRRGGLVLVLDLRLGERGLAVHAPVDGLEPLVDGPLPDEAPELAHDDGLVGRVQRGVPVHPVAEDPEALEFFALDVDEAQRVLPAAPDLLDGIHGLAHIHAGLIETELEVDLMLDRKAVTVPTRHVHGVVTEHRPRLDDEILQDLVERRPQVDVSVGVGRAVMENPQGPLRGGLANAGVDVHLLPLLEHLRLELGQVGLHRERGLGKVERVLVVHRGRNVTPMRV